MDLDELDWGNQDWNGQDWDDSRLRDYLSYDCWSSHIGLCTLSGFDYRTCAKGDNSAPAQFQFASALSPSAFMSYMHENRAAEEQLLSRMNEDIDRLRGFWENSGKDVEDGKYAPADFIEWALSKNFTPDWLRWAIERKLYIKKQEADTHSQPKAQPPINNTSQDVKRRLVEHTDALGVPAPEAKPASVANSSDWKEQARAIADECFDADTKAGCRDSLNSYSKRVMEKMQERGIKGPRGIIDNANTIKREALQGGKWWQITNK